MIPRMDMNFLQQLFQQIGFFKNQRQEAERELAVLHEQLGSLQVQELPSELIAIVQSKERAFNSWQNERDNYDTDIWKRVKDLLPPGTEIGFYKNKEIYSGTVTGHRDLLTLGHFLVDTGDGMDIPVKPDNIFYPYNIKELLVEG